jgi:NTP pyrophosphatase (non-canonical NTP hydrolase)
MTSEDKSGDEFRAKIQSVIDKCDQRLNRAGGIAEQVNALVKHAHDAAYSAGWYGFCGTDLRAVMRNSKPNTIEGRLSVALAAEKLALIHSEISEALEGLRRGKRDDHLPHRLSLEVELADAMIRILDLAGCLDLDLGGAMVEKMAYNAKRADHKAEARQGEGGKVF